MGVEWGVMKDRWSVLFGCLGCILPVALVVLFAYYVGIVWVILWGIAWKVVSTVVSVACAWYICKKGGGMTPQNAETISMATNAVIVLMGNVPLVVLIWATIHEGGIMAFWDACEWQLMRI